MSLSTAATIHQIDREREKPLIAFWQEKGTSVCAYVKKVIKINRKSGKIRISNEKNSKTIAQMKKKNYWLLTVLRDLSSLSCCCRCLLYSAIESCEKWAPSFFCVLSLSSFSVYCRLQSDDEDEMYLICIPHSSSLFFFRRSLVSR